MLKGYHCAFLNFTACWQSFLQYREKLMGQIDMPFPLFCGSSLEKWRIAPRLSLGQCSRIVLTWVQFSGGEQSCPT